MYKVSTICAGILVLGSAKLGWAAPLEAPESDCASLKSTIEKDWKDPSLKLELQRLYYEKGCHPVAEVQANAVSRKILVSTLSAAPSPAPPALVRNTPSKPVSPTSTDGASQVRFLLRQDFTDAGLVTDPTSNSRAIGAGIAYSNDAVGKNSSWTLHGTAIGAYNFDNGFGPSQTVNLFAGSFGLYAGANKTTNTNAKLVSQNVDTDTFGGFLEMGFDHIMGGDQWLRVKVGAVNDNIKLTSAVSTTAEWIPVYSDFLIHWPHFFSTPLTQIGIRFDPELKVQFDNAVNQTLLFSNGRDALRIGPQFGLWIQPFADIAYLSNLNINLVYHWAYETYSKRDLSWFQVAATYNLDPNGMLGLTASYQKGSDETTGKQTDIVKLTLSSKLDYCSAWCPPPKQ